MEIIELNQIIDFENSIIDAVKSSNIFTKINNIVITKKFKSNLQINRFIRDGKYYSQIVINITDLDGLDITEKQEPNCVLMVCETLCYVKKNSLIKLDLLKDDEFMNSLEQLLVNLQM